MVVHTCVLSLTHEWTDHRLAAKPITTGRLLLSRARSTVERAGHGRRPAPRLLCPSEKPVGTRPRRKTRRLASSNRLRYDFYYPEKRRHAAGRACQPVSPPLVVRPIIRIVPSRFRRDFAAEQVVIGALGELDAVLTQRPGLA